MNRLKQPPFPRHRFARHAFTSSAIALTLALAPVAGLAQGTPGFSLPEPTPPPTPRPQGPADERAGVRIGPRIIPQTQPSPQPTSQPTQAPVRAATPAPSPTPTPAPTATRAPARTATTPAPRPAPTPTPAASTARPRPVATPTPAASPAIPASPVPREIAEPGAGAGPLVTPGFDTELLPDFDETPIGPNDWYDVSPDGEAGDAIEQAPRNDVRPPEGAFSASLETVGAMALRNQTYVGLGIMALLALVLAGLYWRRRRIEAAESATDGPSLAYGVHRIIRERDSVPEDSGDALTGHGAVQEAAEQQPDPSTPEPEAVPAAAVSTKSRGASTTAPVLSEPPRIDLALEITGATRSVMMFTINFRLEISNRSDGAVRDLSVAAQLASAQRGASNAPPIAGGQPIGEIDRLGPQQSRRVPGTLQVPIADINLIQQGAKPLFIPLLHFTLEGAGLPAMNRTFVVGTPSETSQSRVHPLTLDGPPGGLPMLRAQMIKQPEAEEV